MIKVDKFLSSCLNSRQTLIGHEPNLGVSCCLKRAYMNRRRWKSRCLWISLLLPLSIIVQASPTSGNQGVRGSYWVIKSVDLGAEVRVNLRIRLSNATGDRLFITGLGLADTLHPARASESKSLILEAHDTSSFTQEFTISSREYSLWQNGHRPQLSLKIQLAGGEKTLMVILMKRPA